MPTEVKKYHFDIHDIRERIDWNYFFSTWGLGKAGDKEKMQLRREAESFLGEWEGKCKSYAILMRTPANSDGDDIVIGGALDFRLPMLRQQNMEDGPLLSMADFICPRAKGVKDELGLFCATVDAAILEKYKEDPYHNMLAQTLADRLAEATAERLNDEMPGIRPAVGFPMMPDMSMNFLLDEILDMGQIGITLTESGMMQPHASVSGLIFANSGARYFAIGPIGDDQLADYARRRGMAKDDLRRFIRNI